MSDQPVSASEMSVDAPDMTTISKPTLSHKPIIMPSHPLHNIEIMEQVCRYLPRPTLVVLARTYRVGFDSTIKSLYRKVSGDIAKVVVDKVKAAGEDTRYTTYATAIRRVDHRVSLSFGEIDIRKNSHTRHPPPPTPANIKELLDHLPELETITFQHWSTQHNKGSAFEMYVKGKVIRVNAGVKMPGDKPPTEDDGEGNDDEEEQEDGGDGEGEEDDFVYALKEDRHPYSTEFPEYKVIESGLVAATKEKSYIEEMCSAGSKDIDIQRYDCHRIPTAPADLIKLLDTRAKFSYAIRELDISVQLEGTKADEFITMVAQHCTELRFLRIRPYKEYLQSKDMPRFFQAIAEGCHKLQHLRLIHDDLSGGKMGAPLSTVGRGNLTTVDVWLTGGSRIGFTFLDNLCTLGAADCVYRMVYPTTDGLQRFSDITPYVRAMTELRLVAGFDLDPRSLGCYTWRDLLDVQSSTSRIPMAITSSLIYHHHTTLSHISAELIERALISQESIFLANEILNGAITSGDDNAPDGTNTALLGDAIKELKKLDATADALAVMLTKLKQERTSLKTLYDRKSIYEQELKDEKKLKEEEELKMIEEEQVALAEQLSLEQVEKDAEKAGMAGGAKADEEGEKEVGSEGRDDVEMQSDGGVQNEGANDSQDVQKEASVTEAGTDVSVEHTTASASTATVSGTGHAGVADVEMDADTEVEAEIVHANKTEKLLDPSSGTTSSSISNTNLTSATASSSTTTSTSMSDSSSASGSGSGPGPGIAEDNTQDTSALLVNEDTTMTTTAVDTMPTNSSGAAKASGEAPLLIIAAQVEHQSTATDTANPSGSGWGFGTEYNKDLGSGGDDVVMDESEVSASTSLTLA